MAGSLVASLPMTVTGNNLPVTLSMRVDVYATGDISPRVTNSSSLTWAAKENTTKTLAVGISDLLVNGGSTINLSITISGPSGMPGLPSTPYSVTGVVPIGYGSASLGTLTTTFGAAYSRPSAKTNGVGIHG